MSIDFTTNLDRIGDIVGSMQGAAQEISGEGYMQSLLEKSHFEASMEFDRAAAATGSAGKFSHMYEYGTVGITPGPAKFPDATSPAARLYTHEMSGRGGTQDIYYAFRPALERNPQPTTASTGVPSKYLRKLSKRKYIFRERAYITETGQTVKIRPKSGKNLFVPFYSEPSDNPLNTKGFMMYPFSATAEPLSVTPGREQAGSFTKFWLGWWEGRGQQLLSDAVEGTVILDMESTLDAAAARAATSSMRPAGASNIIGRSSASRREARMKLQKKSAERNRKRK